MSSVETADRIGRYQRDSLLARVALVALAAALFAGCATLPPGADFPKVASIALAHPDETHLGSQFMGAAREHGGRSGFRIITVGIDGFLVRAQMIDAAERTLDLQYFIFRGDETGRLLTDALLRAADRGVRVRVLVDDADTVAGDEQVLALDAHPGIEVRVFNPFRYRGHSSLIRGAEFLLNHSRLDYRMHNKLIVSDNAVALAGGRNVGNQYFQIDPESQFADDDVFAAGPIVSLLSATFDAYWNSASSIPAAALDRGTQNGASATARRAADGPAQASAPLEAGGVDYVKRIATGEPYAGLISGRLPLVWAHATVVADSPNKKSDEGIMWRGQLMTQAIADAASNVQSELLVITPYFIPAHEDRQLLAELRRHGARVRVLTNSLEATPDTIAHSGYQRYRVPLLESGIELYEVRSLLGDPRGSGQSRQLTRYGTYALHAKFFVFDRRQLVVGSMNFDQRSKRLNTEIGLIIDSPELAQQTASRFEAMARPENAYKVVLRQTGSEERPRLVWQTREDGKPVEYTREPARTSWQKLEVGLYAMLPIEDEL